MRKLVIGDATWRREPLKIGEVFLVDWPGAGVSDLKLVAVPNVETRGTLVGLECE